MEQLQIYLFGGFLLERGGIALPPIASRAGRSLFAHLVMHPDRPLQRDLLAGIFWPDLPDGRARRRLSHTLWQIQDVVNTPSVSYLDVTTDTLAFDASSPYWLDVAEFDRSFTSTPPADNERPRRDGQGHAQLRTCVELYRGDFLAGYFDDWVLVEQDHYRQRYLTALRRLVDSTKASGAYDEALVFARRLTHHDPLSEDAHQEVMRLCFLLGRTTDAIEQFERCRSVLEEELGTTPSPPTVEIYEKILRQRRAGIRPLGEEERAVLQGRRSDAPFVGREDERRLLVDSMERVLAGSGGVVLVEGEPGVGKTRLTLEAAEDARWRGFEVSWGSCRPGAIRPFAPLIEVLESLSPLRVEQLSEQVASVWLGEAAKIAPALGRRLEPDASAPLRPAEASTRMIESVAHTIEALGNLAPQVVIVDDIHWADQDTLAVLTQLGSRLAGSRVLLLLLYRSEEARGDEEIWDVLRDLDRAAGLGRVVLSPLSVFELEEMVRRILGVGRLEAGVAARLHRQTGGNVLFTLETLLALRDRGLFEMGDDPAAVLNDQMAGQSIDLGPRVRSVIESRIALLGPDVISVYELAAVCADYVDVPLVEGAAGMTRSAVLDALDELLYRGLIRDDGGGRYRIAHDQVGQVVYDGIDPGRRRTLHQQLAETMTSTDPENVEAIGHHFRRGGDAVRATRFLTRAGERSVELNAYATARHHFETARLASTKTALGDEERYELLSQLESVLDVLGRRAEQEELLDEMRVVAEGLPGMAGDLARRRARALAQTGDFQEAEASARRSLEVERRRTDRTGLANSLVTLGTILRWSGRPLDAVPLLEEAVVTASESPQRADALTELASTLAEVAQRDAALARVAEADSIYREQDNLRGQAEVAGIEARTLHQMGESERARFGYERAIELCRRLGYRHGEGVNLTNLANLQQLHGAVAGALDGYDQAASIFAELGNDRGAAMVLANSASARHHLLGDDERAESDAVRAMRVFSEIGDRAREAQCQEILAGIAARRGDLTGAHRMLESSLEALAGTGNVYLEGQHHRSLALLQIEEGQPEAALDTVTRASHLAAESDLGDLSVDLLSIRGLALLSQGDAAAAVAATREAVSRLGPGVGQPYMVLHRHALATAAAGLDAEAREAALRADAVLRHALAELPSDQFDAAVQRVPVHREIVAAAGLLTPHTVVVQLPRASAPTGRALEPEDLCTVSWTLEHPDDDAIQSGIQRRRARLARLLSEASAAGATASTEDLARVLDVSPSTVRRDLSVLRSEGLRATTRGQRRRIS